MAATLTDSRLRVGGNFQLQTVAPPQGTASTSTLRNTRQQQGDAYALSFQHGTGSGQCDLYVCQQRTLNAGASETLNLFDGSLVGSAGEATGFATVKAVVVCLIANPDGSTAGSSVTVGNAASNGNQFWFGAATHTATVYRSGAAFQQGDPAGKTVDATHCNLKVANNDGANKVTYQLLIAGVSN